VAYTLYLQGSLSQSCFLHTEVEDSQATGVSVLRLHLWEELCLLRLCCAGLRFRLCLCRLLLALRLAPVDGETSIKISLSTEFELLF
jgi:hypothetical protein